MPNETNEGCKLLPILRLSPKRMAAPFVALFYGRSARYSKGERGREAQDSLVIISHLISF